MWPMFVILIPKTRMISSDVRPIKRTEEYLRMSPLLYRTRVWGAGFFQIIVFCWRKEKQKLTSQGQQNYITTSRWLTTFHGQKYYLTTKHGEQNYKESRTTVLLKNQSWPVELVHNQSQTRKLRLVTGSRTTTQQATDNKITTSHGQ